MLERLRFGGTVRSNLFGLGMVLIGFTFCAYITLLSSAIRYMPLGHIGSRQKNQTDGDEIPPQRVASGKSPSSIGAENSMDGQRKDVWYVWWIYSTSPSRTTADTDLQPVSFRLFSLKDTLIPNIKFNSFPLYWICPAFLSRFNRSYDWWSCKCNIKKIDLYSRL